MKVKREILRSEVTGGIYKMREYDENGNLVYFMDSLRDKKYEEWRVYDENNYLIHSKDNEGNEINNMYDENGVKIHADIYEYEFYPEDDGIDELAETTVDWKARIEKFVSDKVLFATGGVGFAAGVVLAVVTSILF